MPLGIEDRSHAGQRRFGWQRQSGGPVPPHPNPLPKEREPRWPRYELAGTPDIRESDLASPSPQRRGCSVVVARDTWMPQFVTTRPIVLPLPWGAGWGEGERGSRRFHGARSSEQHTFQARVQFRAALDKNIGAPPDSKRLVNAPARAGGISRAVANQNGPLGRRQSRLKGSFSFGGMASLGHSAACLPRSSAVA